MNIAVISAQVFPCPPLGYSGLEMIAWLCAKNLAARGHAVNLYAPEGSWCPGVNVIHTGPPGQWNEVVAFQKYANHLPQFDVVIDHTWTKPSYQMKVDGMLKPPILGVMHAPVNTMYQTLPRIPNPCFVCISKDQADHFKALHSIEARVAYNGIDLKFYKSLGMPRTRRFLFLGRFSSIKGADLAIEACKAAGAGLDLIGDTSITNEPDYLKKCQEMCDGEQIRMIGAVSRSESVWWYSQAHAMIHANKRFREPFGLAPVEAQACGCPVIAWDYGAMKETVVHGSTGVLVKSEEELVQAVKSIMGIPFADAQREVFRNGVLRFSEENMATQYEFLCDEAIKGGW